jgi:predicted N-acyltransferase
MAGDASPVEVTGKRGWLLQLKLLTSIRQADPTRWNTLAGDSIFSTYGWLRTVEETHAGRNGAKYLLLFDREKIVAAAVLCIQPKGRFGGNLDHILFGRLFRLASAAGISSLPALVCGPLFGCGDHFLYDRALPFEERKPLAERLLSAIEAIGVRLKFPVAFLNVSDSDPGLCDLLQGRGYLKSSLAPYAYMDIGFSSFDAYLNHLKRQSQSAAKSVRHEINRNRALGTIITATKKPGDAADHLHRLLARNYANHNRIPFMFDSQFLRRLSADLGTEVTFYVASRKNKSHGVCLFLQKGPVGHVLLAGIDHLAAGNDYTYFNLCYYQPIKEAIRKGTERLYFGTGLYRMKERRGCKTLPVSLYYRPGTRIATPLFRLWLKVLTERIKKLK